MRISTLSKLRGEDIAFLAQLVAPDFRPMVAPEDVENRLSAAGLVVRLHGTLNATARGLQLVDELYKERFAAEFPGFEGAAPSSS